MEAEEEAEEEAEVVVDAALGWIDCCYYHDNLVHLLENQMIYCWSLLSLSLSSLPLPT